MTVMQIERPGLLSTFQDGWTTRFSKIWRAGRGADG